MCVLLQTWNSIFGKGCLYLDASDEGRGHPLIRAHHYHLTLPSPTHVWVEVGVAPPGNPATDIQVFVFQTDGDEKLTDLVTYTQHKMDQVRLRRLRSIQHIMMQLTPL